MNKLQSAMHFKRNDLRRKKEIELRDKILKDYNPNKGSIDDLIIKEDVKNARNLYSQFIEGLFWDLQGRKDFIIDNYNQEFKNALVGITYRELFEWQKRLKEK